VRVGVRTLRGIDASGACIVDVDGVAGGDFRVALSGASQFTGNGRVDRLDADLSGASRISASTLTALIATVRLSGASVALLRVVQSLTGSVDGASTLDYLGDPSVQVSTSGASTVRRAGP
jgi:Putative auto-transporter adhesin, head GIN domain